MHELGVVFYIIDDVEKVAKENNAEKVRSVTIELGEVSSVVPALLEDCWNWAVTKHDFLLGCKIKIETIDAVTFCTKCESNYPTVKYGKICPNCGSDETYLIKGNEFIIKEIEIQSDE